MPSSSRRNHEPATETPPVTTVHVPAPSSCALCTEEPLLGVSVLYATFCTTTFVTITPLGPVHTCPFHAHVWVAWPGMVTVRWVTLRALSEAAALVPKVMSPLGAGSALGALARSVLVDA